MRGRSRVLIVVGCAVTVATAVVLAERWRGEHDAPMPFLPQASCGSAWAYSVYGNSVVTRADPGSALTCFGTAARTCRSASIQMVVAGVDSGGRYVFGTKPGGAKCQVIEISRACTVSFGNCPGQVSSKTCSSVTVTGRGVTFTCDGDVVLIPAVVTDKATAGA